MQGSKDPLDSQLLSTVTKGDSHILAFVYSSGLSSLQRIWITRYGLLKDSKDVDKHYWDEDLLQLLALEQKAINARRREIEERDPKIRVVYTISSEFGLDIWHPTPDQQYDADFNFRKGLEEFVLYTGNTMAIFNSGQENDRRDRFANTYSDTLLTFLYSPEILEQRTKVLSHLLDELCENRRGPAGDPERIRRQVVKDIQHRLWVSRMSQHFRLFYSEYADTAFFQNYEEETAFFIPTSTADPSIEDIRKRTRELEEISEKLSKTTHIPTIFTLMKREDALRTQVDQEKQIFVSNWHFDKAAKEFDKIKKDEQAQFDKRPGLELTKQAAIAAGKVIAIDLFNRLWKKMNGNQKAFEGIGQLIVAEAIPAAVKVVANYFLGPFGGQAVDVIAGAIFKRPSPPSELRRFIDGEFAQFRKEINERLDILLEETRLVQANTEEILQKISSIESIIADIIYDAQDHLFLTLLKEQVRGKMDTRWSTIIGKIDKMHLVTEEDYKDSTHWITNYQEPLEQLFTKTVNYAGVESLSELEANKFVRNYIKFMMDPYARKGSMIYNIKVRAESVSSERNFSYNQALVFTVDMLEDINQFVNQLCTQTDQMAEFLSCIYHFPLNDSIPASQRPTTLQGNIFKYLHEYFTNYIGFENQLTIGKNDTSEFNVNIAAPSFNSIDFLTRTFGQNLMSLWQNLFQTSIFAILVEEKQLQVANLKDDILTGPNVFNVAPPLDNLGKEQKNVSYKWKVTWDENNAFLHIQIIQNNELKFLTGQGASSATPRLCVESLDTLDRGKVPDKYRWRVSLSDSGSYVKMNLANVGTGARIRNVVIRSYHASMDAMTRDEYFSELETFVKDGKLPEGAERKALSLVSRRPKPPEKVNYLIGLAYFDAEYDQVLYPGVEYHSINGGPAFDTPFLIVEPKTTGKGTQISIRRWEGNQSKILSSIPISKMVTYDLLRYQAVDAHGAEHPADFKKGGLFAFSLDEDGPYEIGGRKYRKEQNEALETLSGVHSRGMVLYLSEDGILRIANKLGKVAWRHQLPKSCFIVDNLRIHRMRFEWERRPVLRDQGWLFKHRHLKSWLQSVGTQRAYLELTSFNYRRKLDKNHKYEIFLQFGIYKNRIIPLESVNLTQPESGPQRGKQITALRIGKGITPPEGYQLVSKEEVKENDIPGTLGNLNAGVLPDLYLYAKDTSIPINYSDAIIEFRMLHENSKKHLEEAIINLGKGWIVIDHDLNSTEPKKDTFARLCYKTFSHKPARIIN